MTGLLQLLLLVSTTFASEPSCPAYSKYDYEQNLLEIMIRMAFTVEQDLTRLEKENKRLNAVVEKQNLDWLRSQMQLRETKSVHSRWLGLILTKHQVFIPAENFHAHSPHTSSLTTGDVIVYKTVETNQGNGYSSTTGKFTTPVQGLYLFLMQACIDENKYSFLQIVKEGSILIPSGQYDTDHNTCSSSQVFVQLDAGETVWVQCSDGATTVQLYDNHPYRWTSFGGAFIHK